MRKEMYVMILYLFGLLFFSILCASYLDVGRPEVLSIVIIPLLIVSGGHALIMSYYVLTNERKWSLNEISFTSAFLVFTLLLFLNSSEVISAPEWLLVLPGFLCISQWLIAEVTSFNTKSHESLVH